MKFEQHFLLSLFPEAANIATQNKSQGWACLSFLLLLPPCLPSLYVGHGQCEGEKGLFTQLARGYAPVGDCATLSVYCFDPDAVYGLRLWGSFILFLPCSSYDSVFFVIEISFQLRLWARHQGLVSWSSRRFT
jgi:hypothetical protein